MDEQKEVDHLLESLDEAITNVWDKTNWLINGRTNRDELSLVSLEKIKHIKSLMDIALSLVSDITDIRMHE